MQRLTSKPASIYAIIAFILTLAFSFAMPGYPITLAGLLVVIFLSFFIKDTKSTIIATILGIIITLLLYWLSGINFIQHLFIIFLVLVSAVIVLYMKRLNSQLNFEKSHMTALFENTTEGIILTDESGKIVLANPASEKMFAYEENEMINKPMEILLPQSIRSKHVKLRNTFYENPQHRSMGSGRDLYAQKKSGENFPVEVSLSYYYEAGHRYVIAFIVNITPRKQIEESMRLQQKQLEQVSNEIRDLNSELERKVEERTLILQEALQKLEQSQHELSEALDKERELNEIKSRFVSMASHEFRTPLSTVLSSASLLSKYITTEDQDKRERHINRIKDSVKHLNDILEDFLSLGKLDEGKVTTSFSPLNLTDLLRDVLEEMKPQTKPGQKIEYICEGNCDIHSDKNLLRNILIILISNAIKFSDEEKTIWIDGKVADNTVTISIKDEGIGISEDDQQYLYSSFFRGKNAVNIQGTGLGLHIVKRYLGLLNGTINLQTGLESGTTFIVIIPASKVQI
ncbi:MAG: PAS domain-containing sensor histidine kinase [Ginsengibacter sp.]